MSWYFARDPQRRARQIVIHLPPAKDEPSKFGSLALAGQYEHLLSKSWCAGYFRLDSDPGPFLLVRCDKAVELLRTCPLRVAISFYREPAGGLFGLYVTVDESRAGSDVVAQVRRASPNGQALFECLNGLDYQKGVDLIRDALARDVIHMCFARASSNLTVEQLQPDGTFRRMTPPAGCFDKTYPVPEDCRQLIVKEFQELVAYHRAIAPSKRSFPDSISELSQHFPESADPVLPASFETSEPPSGRPPFWRRWFGGAAATGPAKPPAAAPPAPPFEKLEHAVVFARDNLQSFTPPDSLLQALEEITGRTMEEVSARVRLQLYRNCGETVDASRKQQHVSIVAAAELALKGHKDLPNRLIAGTLQAKERYVRDAASGQDFAIVLLYGA